MRKHASALEREAWRKRWRGFVVPHWRRLETEVLDETEARVLGLRLGVVNDVGLPQHTIAKRLHLSDTTVAAIERRALAKVRVALSLGGQ